MTAFITMIITVLQQLQLPRVYQNHFSLRCCSSGVWDREDQRNSSQRVILFLHSVHYEYKYDPFVCGTYERDCSTNTLDFESVCLETHLQSCLLIKFVGLFQSSRLFSASISSWWQGRLWQKFSNKKKAPTDQITNLENELMLLKCEPYG